MTSRKTTFTFPPKSSADDASHFQEIIKRLFSTFPLHHTKVKEKETIVIAAQQLLHDQAKYQNLENLYN